MTSLFVPVGDRIQVDLDVKAGDISLGLRRKRKSGAIDTRVFFAVPTTDDMGTLADAFDRAAAMLRTEVAQREADQR